MRLLDRLRREIQARNYSPRTERVYVGWIRRFIRFHDRRHPRDLGAEQITRFLNHLVLDRRVSAWTRSFGPSDRSVCRSF